MENIIFSDETSEKIVTKIRDGNYVSILEQLFRQENDTIVIDYLYFKYIAGQTTYTIITELLLSVIDTIVKQHNTFYVYVNMRSCSLSDIDKHKTYMTSLVQILRDRYTDKLEQCYITNASFVFTSIYNFLCLIIDKKTQQKIQLVNNSGKSIKLGF
jgi:hypothetical protein